MLGITDLSSWPLTVAGPLIIALVLLLMRVFVMGRAQEKRQRANRQQTERLKSLVSAYRVIAGSFQPLREGESMNDADQGAMEAALSDILLFGSATQVAMASECAHALIDGKIPPLYPLVEDLRRDLRVQLGLAPIDASIALPMPGPLRGKQSGRKEANGEREGAGAGRGGGGGGAGGGLLIGGSASGALHVEDDIHPQR